MSSAPIYLGNDFECEVTLTRKNANTGAAEPDTGHLGLTVRLAATSRGAAIDPALQKSLVERASAPGVFSAVLAGADLSAKLASYVGKTVYEVVTDGATILAEVARPVLAERRL